MSNALVRRRLLTAATPPIPVTILTLLLISGLVFTEVIYYNTVRSRSACLLTRSPRSPARSSRSPRAIGRPTPLASLRSCKSATSTLSTATCTGECESALVESVPGLSAASASVHAPTLPALPSRSDMNLTLDITVAMACDRTL